MYMVPSSKVYLKVVNIISQCVCVLHNEVVYAENV